MQKYLGFYLGVIKLVLYSSLGGTVGLFYLMVIALALEKENEF